MTIDPLISLDSFSVKKGIYIRYRALEYAKPKQETFYFVRLGSDVAQSDRAPNNNRKIASSMSRQGITRCCVRSKNNQNGGAAQ